MLGKSHLMFGLTAGVVFDSFVHVSGPPLVGSTRVTLALVINKAIFYFMVGFGSLLPDVDNARSTLGRKLGGISKGIQHTVGHRTLFHSFLGLFLGSLLALVMEQLLEMLLISRGLVLPAEVMGSSHIVLIAVLFGAIMHITADALTREGVPLFWPSKGHYGFPPNRNWRFVTGTWPEHVIVYAFLILVGIGVYYAAFTI